MSTSTPTIVAWIYAGWRSRCRRCDRVIEKGDRIAKVDVGLRGSQTSGGNGQGHYWCSTCAVAGAVD